MGPEPAPATPANGTESSLVERIAKRLDSVTAVMVFVGLLLYAALRAYADSFYGGFDATSEEAGLTYSSILTRAALGIAGAVLTGAFLALVWYIVALIANQFDVVPEPWRRRMANVGVGSGALSFVYGVTHQLEFWMVLGIALVAASCAAYLLDWRPPPEHEGKVHVRSVAIVALAIGSAVALFGTATRAGAWDAESVGQGRELSGNVFYGLGAVRADCVMIAWTGGKAPRSLELTSPYLLLGQANGQALFTQGQEGVPSTGPPTWRLPLGNLVLTSVTTNGRGICAGSG